MSGSVAGYVQAVDRVLAAGQGLFPGGSSAPSGFGAGHSGVPAAPASSGLSDGVGAAAETYRGHWATVTGLDDGAGKASADGQDAGSSGHAGATGVRQSAQSSAQALAPTTKSPAGVTKLVSTMDDRLAAMQRQIDTTTAQNRVLSMRLRQLAAGFRGMGGAGGAMGGSMMPGGMGGGGMPGGGMGGGFGGGGGAMGSLAGLSGLPQSFMQTGYSAGDRGPAADGAQGPAADEAVQVAESKIGRPYVWGATGPNAFDCSGLVQYAYRHAGINLPRTTYEMMHAGRQVPLSDIRRGDLILCNWSAPNTPEHVMMAIGNGMAVEAPTPGARVQISHIPMSRVMVRRVA